MFGLLVFGLFIGAVLLFAGVVGAILKLAFWLVFLPLRLAGAFLKVLLAILLLPVVAVAGVVAIVGVGLALLAPLLPLLLAGVLIWGLVKLASRPAVARRA